MANIVPGAVWQPVDVGARAKRRKGRALVGHVAVSNAITLVPGPLATRGADWHFYLPKVGPAIQYIDLDLQCWATGAGNADCVAFESQGGMGTTAQVNAEPWTDNQIEWAARILAYLHSTEGVPLQVMPDSKATSRGFGTHRLGVPGFMAAGGQVWSSSAGKLCPGDRKHAQRIDVVTRAQQILNGDDDMGLSYEDTKKALWEVVMQPDVLDGIAARVHDRGIKDDRGGWSLAERVAGIDKTTQVSPAQIASLVVPAVTATVAAASSGVAPSQASLEAALREVLGSVDNTSS